MGYQLLADLTVLLHFLFILFAIAGAALVVRWARLAWVHLPTVLWAVVMELAGWYCPLTPLENLLRRVGGEATYQEGFIAHYLLPVIYPTGLTRPVQITLGAGLLVFNVAMYVVVLRRVRGGSTGSQTSS